MRTKKPLIVIAICVSLLLGLFIVYILTRPQNDRIPIGKYRIKDNIKYPDAYIEVTEHTIQYFNIDLNEYYQEMQMHSYRRVVDNDPEYYGVITDEQLKKLTDLNTVYVDQPFDYSEVEAIKTGTNTYTYRMTYHDNFLGVGLRYYTNTHRLEARRNEVILVFEKEQ
ncbi:MAG: hypothetical protein IK125_01925 [Lachnospiraceae bacterium]|nr:hypothetical protein [Lachnospiraceae bacterium]